MVAYFKCGKHFAVHCELSRELGFMPFFGLNTCNGETIVDIPFGRIILTPRKKLLAETRHDDIKRQNGDLASPAARTTEN